MLTWLEQNARQVVARVDAKDPLVEDCRAKWVMECVCVCVWGGGGGGGGGGRGLFSACVVKQTWRKQGKVEG